MIAFYVPGPPCGKQRPRVLKTGRAYTPAKTAAYEAHVRGSARQDRVVPEQPLDGPLAVSMDVAIGIPKSWSAKKKMQASTGALLPTGKPDLDNIAKSLGDALNGVLWADDAQIISWQATKRYGLAPGVWVRVERV
jgi:Holliday junction resolvase RusA-like endonuclease